MFCVNIVWLNLPGIRTRLGLLCSNPDIMGAASWIDPSIRALLTPLVITSETIICHVTAGSRCAWALMQDLLCVCLCCHAVIAHRFTIEPVLEQLCVAFVFPWVNAHSICRRQPVRQLPVTSGAVFTELVFFQTDGFSEGGHDYDIPADDF